MVMEESVVRHWLCARRAGCLRYMQTTTMGHFETLDGLSCRHLTYAASLA